MFQGCYGKMVTKSNHIFCVEHVPFFRVQKWQKKLSAVAILHVAPHWTLDFFTLRCGGAVSDMGICGKKTHVHLIFTSFHSWCSWMFIPPTMVHYGALGFDPSHTILVGSEQHSQLVGYHNCKIWIERVAWLYIPQTKHQHQHYQHQPTSTNINQHQPTLSTSSTNRLSRNQFKPVVCWHLPSRPPPCQRCRGARNMGSTSMPCSRRPLKVCSGGEAGAVIQEGSSYLWSICHHKIDRWMINGWQMDDTWMISGRYMIIYGW